MGDCYYSNREDWYGGFYELSIEYHPLGDDKRIIEALAALFNSSYLNGESISLPIRIEEDRVHSFYGKLSLSKSKEDLLPVLITVTRVIGESDWLDIAIPQTAFELKYPYEYPLTTELNPWLEEINEVYIQLAEMIYGNSPFDLALIGEEITGCTNQQDITYEAMQNFICILPNKLIERLGLEGRGKELSNQLRMFG